MGARPLRRTIEQYLEDPLAEKLLSNPNEGRKCMVTVEGDKLVFVDRDIFTIPKDKDRDRERRVKIKDKDKNTDKESQEDKQSTDEAKNV